MDPAKDEVGAWSQFYLGETVRPPQPGFTINSGLEEKPAADAVPDPPVDDKKKERGAGRKKTAAKKPTKKKAVKRKAAPQPAKKRPPQKRRKIKESSVHALVYSGNFKPKKNTKRVVF
jgi:hypothetical protein